MHWIYLDGIELTAPVGITAEEQHIGNTLRIDLGVACDFSAAAAHDDIGATIDYEALYKVVAEALDQPTKLLETVSGRIVRQLFEDFPMIEEVHLELSKLSPPIRGKAEKARIVIREKR